MDMNKMLILFGDRLIMSNNYFGCFKSIAQCENPLLKLTQKQYVLILEIKVHISKNKDKSKACLWLMLPPIDPN